eukprot:990796-Pleurochrysis_carterae.AAC.2
MDVSSHSLCPTSITATTSRCASRRIDARCTKRPLGCWIQRCVQLAVSRDFLSRRKPSKEPSVSSGGCNPHDSRELIQIMPSGSTADAAEAAGRHLQAIYTHSCA